MQTSPHRARMRFPVLISLVLFVAAVFLAPNSAGAQPRPEIGAAIDKYLATPALEGGLAGVLVERVSDGELVYEHNADTRLMPASNRKLFSTASGLAILGKDYRFQTRVLSMAPADAQGAIKGDVILKGEGDSTIMPTDLDEMAEQLWAKGVRSIRGNIVGDGNAFPGQPYGAGWGWDYLSDDYAAQIWGLEVNRGVITVRVKAGAGDGDPVTVALDPPVTKIPIVSSATTGGKEPDCLITRDWNSSVILISGHLPVGQTTQIDIAVGDPVTLAAELFQAALVKRGIDVQGIAYSAVTPVAAETALATHYSVPLDQYLKLTNKPSDNLLAESIIREIGRVKAGKGTYEAGYTEEQKWWLAEGIDTHLVQLADGSGVSRRDYVTARAVVALLRVMAKRSDFPVYYDSLPIAGVDGTLRKRMKGTSAEKNVHAKTGTVGEVSCLSGYLTAKDNTLYTFSILMNNIPGSASQAQGVQNLIVAYLTDHL
ncbi:MAG: D-alanyl-D-alanine carboxypeptidase/D-alanyl-D-alanine-endopeptidase [Capsulimonas sp.]|uniref:D-alanyl-D-alanine carboxypeptidase/D-alanyl-D-alanine endopeptidase n=1 Tax=Capsulimonas sp. TaxID=2494211 RepID=UPI003266D214